MISRSIKSRMVVSLLIFAPSAEAAVGRSRAAGALQSSNRLNPNISAIGWFQGEAGRRVPEPGAPAVDAFEFKEAELALQSVVDPYARADIFVGFGKDEVEIEEAYVATLDLPYDLGLKLGKFKANVGRFNRVHTPETDFGDLPLVHEKYFGEEGLGGAGASLSWHVPNPWIFANLDVEVLTPPEGGEVPAFAKARRRDLVYVSRLNGYHDLTESLNATLGGSYAYGPAGEEAYDLFFSSRVLRSQIMGADFTLRWKNPRRAIYRSLLWETEVLWNKKDLSHLSAVTSVGLFTHLQYQFARRWRVGARWDWTQAPGDNGKHDQGGLYYLTFHPTEFSALSLQGRHIHRGDGINESLGFLKMTFNIGPHGAHPF